MKISKLISSYIFILHQIILVSAFSFTLPKTTKEDITTDSPIDDSLDQDIRDIFLGEQLTGRFGGSSSSGYSGQSVDIDQNSEVLLQLIQGSALIGDSPAPSDYNLNKLTQVRSKYLVRVITWVI